ncbi:MAG: metal ABC transporter permease, partial [Planctomycetota bacterium]
MIDALSNWDWFLDGWTIGVGALCGVACALLGNFLVLRKMSMMGDAISHAVLPGLAVAFLITGSRASVPMFVGAAAVGVLTALFTEWVRGYGKVDEGASMGVVFTALFALGLVLIVQAADTVEIDPGCVLYGLMEFTPLDTIMLLGVEVPRVAVVLGVVALLNLLFVLAFYKELKLSSFDPQLATTLGVNARLMHYLLMTLVAVTAVASFEAVGNILVVAVLIVPPAAAYLLTDRLPVMIALSVVLAIVGAIVGHVGAIAVPAAFGFGSVSSAGAMAVALGVLLGLSALLGPRHGIVSKAVGRLSLSLRIAREDVLATLYRLEERAAGPASVAVGDVGGVAHLSAGRRRLALGRLSRAGLVDRDTVGRLSLTDAGRDKARQVVRSHRLWETYLDQNASLPSDQLHLAAERLEHATGLDFQAALEAGAGMPAVDPHGRAIPPRETSQEAATGRAT